MTRPPLAPAMLDLLDTFLDSVCKEVIDGKEAFTAARDHLRDLSVFLENTVTQLLNFEFSIDPGAMSMERVALNKLRQDDSWKKATPPAAQALAAAIGDLLYDWTDLTEGAGYAGTSLLPPAILQEELPRLLAALDQYSGDRGDAVLALRLRRAATRVKETFNGVR
jgi:hypothetical protein